jgi:hypothetical protein
VTNVRIPKAVYSIPPETVEMETRNLFPMVKSTEIERFKHNYSGIIVPFPYNEVNPKCPLSRGELRETRLLDYLLKYEEIFNKQTAYYQRIRGPNSGELSHLLKLDGEG